MLSLAPQLLLHVYCTGLYGVAVGYNGTDNAEQAPLRYADDDAVKNAELLADLGAKHVLLTRLDRPTRRLFPDARAEPPTYERLRKTILALNREIDQDTGTTHLYVFYSGHGDVENNRGFVHLQGGRLYRDDFVELLSLSEADFIHVVVDACKSYFLLFSRGAGGKRRVSSSVFHSRNGPPLPRNVGLFLSTSAANDSHEWEAYQGGIFAHQVRSALRGAADLDNDTRVSYTEAAAFVHSANSLVKNERFRPKFWARPPLASKDVPFVALEEAPAARLEVDLRPARHRYIEDGDGVRLADFHPDTRMRVELLLPRRRPLFLRQPASKLEYRIESRAARVKASTLQRHASSVSRRGAEHVAFEQLFGATFGSEAIGEYKAELGAAREIAPPSSRWPFRLRRGLGGLGVSLVGLGGLFTVLAHVEDAKLSAQTPQVERTPIYSRVDRRARTSYVLYSTGGALLLSYLAWTYWPTDDVVIQAAPGLGAPNISVRF